MVTKVKTKKEVVSLLAFLFLSLGIGGRLQSYLAGDKESVFSIPEAMAVGDVANGSTADPGTGGGSGSGDSGDM